MKQDIEFLRRFVNDADESGKLELDWCCRITEEHEDHVVVSFYNQDEGPEMESYVGKLWKRDDGLMVWQGHPASDPIVFSAFPWVLAAIAYAWDN